MKNLIKILFFTLIGYTSLAQDVKISAMTPATDLTGTVFVPIIQEGVNKKAAGSLFSAPLTPTVVKTSNYTAAVGDLVKCDVTTGFTVTLPTAPADKSEIIVKIVAPSSPTNTLTIAAGGSDVFNVASGSTSLSLTRKFQSVWLQYQATGAIWIVKTTDDALGSYVAPIANGGTGTASPGLVAGANITITNSWPNQTISGISGLSYVSNTQTTNYTLVSGDVNKWIRMNSASAISLTVPDNSSVAYPDGTVFLIEQVGDGFLTIVQGGSAIITSSSGNLLAPEKNVIMQLTKVGTGTNTWDLQNGFASPPSKLLSGDVVTTSGTLVDITGMGWSVIAGATYRISGVMIIGCNNTGGVRFFASTPSGTTFTITGFGRVALSSAVSFAGFSSSGATPSAALNTVNSPGGQYVMDGTFTTTNSGNIQLQFESGVAGQTSTVFANGSVIELRRIQ